MIIKELTIFFENCEMITIPGYYIGEFNIANIKTDISRIACNAVMKMTTSDSIQIEIHKDANKLPYYIFGNDPGENDPKTIFERIWTWQDITEIHVVLTDNDTYEDDVEERTEEYSVMPSWVGEDDFRNPAQSVYISKPGHLYISIEAGKTVQDFFPPDIDDDEYAEFTSSMYSTGDKNHAKLLEIYARSREVLEQDDGENV